MRPQTACEFCRSRRRRCQPSSDGGPCAMCRKHNVPCIPSSSTRVVARTAREHAHRNSASSFSNTSIGPGGTSVPDEQALSTTSYFKESPQFSLTSPNVTSYRAVHDVELPPAAVCFHLATLYFDYIHDQLHTLFQKPQFMADLAMNRTSPVIAYAMIALAARFSSNDLFSSTSPRARGVPYARKAAQLLDVSEVSLTSIQACVMLGACRIIEGDAQGESVYYGIACRMAQLLDLPHRQCDSLLEKEIHIRVWHTLCMIDEWSSSGVQVPRQIANPPADVPLPMEEMAFLQLRHENSINMSQSYSNPSLLGEMITLNRIFRDVNQMNTYTVGTSHLPPDTDAVQALSDRLDEWEAMLPVYMRDEPANLAHYAAQGLGRIYAAVYLGFYHYGQLLYYQFLHGSNEESGGLINVFAQRCKYHAARLCNMVYSALDTPGCDVQYNMVGHVLVIASTVQIHTLLFSSDRTEIDAARQRLERNFNILLKLRELWPALDLCMIRLQVFHKACRTSMDNSFQLDGWMLKFLSEFGNPIDDKPENNDAEWIIGDIAITPTSDFGVNTIASFIREDMNS
ncbi:hypothetical protein CKM354_000452800 [Cercospora kikuchii]|uniref:Zn(2)-C6 fungal-type domain-containing protein n=1 Tax=Cercospora kikuchii TaxID=84275 RepID=A0A9P3CK28_9PEZI|nr:uncharacterized protein CKM354_000452800 [Cercospora kikuchii]GIZ41215.1 hypothetical protein CKM354_000452800 [Cercospora kikuchii]